MPTQQEFADHVGITRQIAGEMVRKGTLPPGGTLDEWRLAYCTHLREVATGRSSAKAQAAGLDLTAERARLSKLQADKVEIELAELRGEVVRAEDVARVMQAHIMDLPFFWVYVGIHVALTLTGVFTVDPSLQQDSASRSQTAPRSANRSLPVRAEDSARSSLSA
jgi:hypothetical protein